MVLVKTSPITIRIGIVILLVILGACGCQSRVEYTAKEEAKYLKPTVAVMSFENRAPMHMKWNLGEGLADQLIDRLLNTRRYVVLERQQLHAIFQELKRAQDNRFRQTGQPQPGRLKHVRYLVKGTITDFAHTETVEGFWRLFDWGLFGSSSYATVAATIYVIDVQSGQIIASDSIEAQIKDSKNKDNTQYDGMAFGSYTFYHTPLGRATNKMLDKAVRSIADTIAERPFQPKIASIVNQQVVINGGKDRKIELGTEYIVRPKSDVVFDPDTGDLLGHITQDTIGRVRVSLVTNKYAVADILEGDGFKPGQTLFVSESETAQAPVAYSSY
jgi:curli biogenesis system outer membrane secretion channel CsgG